MKIESSVVQMDSIHSASKFSYTDISRKDIFSLASNESANNKANQSNTMWSREHNTYATPNTFIYIPVNKSTLTVEESFHEINQRLFKHIIEMMHEMLKGNNFKTYSQSDFLTSNNKQSQQQNWYRTQENVYSYYLESESTTYQTEGIVKTSDGREISFGINLSMSRAFMEETQINRVVDDVISFYDPLVINLDAPTAAVTDQTFFFDINCDEKKEKIATLSSGSGFLALDKNGDGIINDGSELFGTNSGDGFKDLSEYDSDGNGWIDENDDVYEHLKVWTKNQDGTDKLLTLKEADVGAIFLGNVSTNFDLKNVETNDTLARIQSTGIFLHESTGAAGTIQHVDFSA